MSVQVTDGKAKARRSVWEGPLFWITWALIIILPLILVPVLQKRGVINPYYYDVLMRTGIAVVMAVSLNIVNGHLGQFSIGHAGFMGVGAFVAGVLIVGGNPGVSGVGVREPGFLTGLPSVSFGSGYTFSLAFLVAMLAGAAAAAMIAFIIGIPAFRTKGDYLAVITLAFNMIIVNIFLNMDYVGGARGLTGLPGFSNFVWVWLAVIATIVISRNLITSAHGRAILSVRENEVAAELGGINTLRYKLIAIAIASGLAGIGGALLAFHVQFINPAMFNIFRSIDFLIMIYLGGVGSITGAAFGAIIWTLLQEVLRPIGIWRTVVGPVLLILIMIFWNRGLMPGELPFIIRKRKGGAQVDGSTSEHK
jgi:branched-chain amino acid transport system permease protein